MNTLQPSEWFPSLLVPFFTLSYPTSSPVDPDSFHDSQYYTTGILDGCLIITCIAVMAVLRDITRIFLMEPFARWKLSRDWQSSQREKLSANGAAVGVSNGSPNRPSLQNGHTSHGIGEHEEFTMSKREARRLHRSVLRFAEQGWSFVYYLVNFSYGVYIHHNLPTRAFNPTDLWLNYPHIPLPGPLKFYYLTQTAFYMHQVLILNAEARRKDHVQMMAHHVITIVLMVSSYAYNFTRIGCLIMVLMDCCDIFLPLAKMLRYIGFYTLCDATFIVFLISWFVTRHIFVIIAIKSVYVDSVRLVSEMWAPERGNYLSGPIHKGFSLLLVTLQILQIIWFGMICRVAYRVVTGQGASDDRSDEEDG
ncbi:TLC domain-containing protein [Melanogaster broomeanus]|nr:TLC domain-containing protein [Melanogaster broomeanus]